MRALLAPASRERMAVNARTAVADLTPTAMAARLVDIYASVLDPAALY
jgi:hypothetical protein